VDERYKCAWMAKHVGEEFAGLVTGVTSFGLFVELDESKVSGLVHISQLSNDYYHFDPQRHLLKGERTGAQFRLGDHVRVQVLRASLEDRKIDFRLVAPRASAAPPPRPGKAYDYAAAGERYSLPGSKAPGSKAPGMVGKAAQAIGRMFGRREQPVSPTVPSPRDNPPPAAAHPSGPVAKKAAKKSDGKPHMNTQKAPRAAKRPAARPPKPKGKR
jgi:ribonuclease R